MMLVMARSEEYLQQLVASEAIIAAASKKKDASVIVSQGLDILKSLYMSKNDHIKGTVQLRDPSTVWIDLQSISSTVSDPDPDWIRFQMG
jgi:hypothetical protein